ncbi:MAG: 30S ribosomal protein S9 [Luteolibacter sp.]
MSTTLNTIGRRKTAVARIWMSEGTGAITINGRSFEEYLPSIELQNSVLAPLQAVSLLNKYDLKVSVKGSGLNAQAIAIRHALSRAICELDAEHRATLKPLGFLTRDPRMKERKKAGQPGARKRFQFSKR